MNNRYALLAAIALPAIILDQLTKLLIVRKLAMNDAIVVITNFFDIVHARNQGAAFGILRDSSIRLPFLIAVSLVAVVVVLIVYRRLRPDQKLAAVSLSLVLAGAVGNLIDRLRLGEVIDFLQVHWYQHAWPAFNVADSAICIGVGLMAVDMYREEKKRREAAAPGNRQ
ncbi:MAG: signal peptidase II [Geobacteraceae bacterium]|nr:signal peptidase II [Geobacteraceae bacterium]